MAGSFISAAVATIFSGGFTAGTGLGVIFGTTTALTAFLVRSAIGLALNALAPKPKTEGANRGYQVSTKGSALDHQIIYGRMRVGGAIVYSSTSGNKNKFLHRIIAFAGHEVESFDEFYIDDEKVVLNGVDYEVSYTYEVFTGKDPEFVTTTKTLSFNNVLPSAASYSVGDSLTETQFNELRESASSVTSDGGTPFSFNETFISADVTAKSDNTSNSIAGNKFKSKIKINTHLGTDDQLADSDLVTDVDEWTSAHRLRGIAYIYVRLEFDPNVFPNGIPDITATIKGKKVFDPRTGSNAWSDNPALCLRDYISSDYGLNEASYNIDDNLVQVGANICDRTSSVDGQKWFTCNGAFTTQVKPYDILNDILSSMGGILWYGQGKWRMKPAYYTAPTITLNEDDLRSSIGVKTKNSRRENYNKVRGTFRGEESDWQVTDYAEVTNVTDTEELVNAGNFEYGKIYTINELGSTNWNTVAGTTDKVYFAGDTFSSVESGSGTGNAFATVNTYLQEDNGQESVLDLDLPFTDTASEARRIARIALERNRKQFTVNASFGLKAFRLQVGDIVKINNSRFSWVEKEFEVTSWTFGLSDGLDLRVQMTLREISESVFDEFDDGASFESSDATQTDVFNVEPPENFVATDGSFFSADGSYVSAFEVSWTESDEAFIDYYALEWKKTENSVWNTFNLSGTTYVINPVESDTFYDFRVKAVNLSGVSSVYTYATSIKLDSDTTAPSLPTSVTATGAFDYNVINWTNPEEKDFRIVKVYASDTDDSGAASFVGSSSGESFIHTGLGNDTTKYYFLTSVDETGNESSFTASVSATTQSESTFTDITVSNTLTLTPASEPSSPSLGETYMDTEDNIVYTWDGSEWRPHYGSYIKL